MGQPPIGAGRYIQKMEATIEQKVIEGLGGRGSIAAVEWIIAKERFAHLFVGFEHAPGKQGAHVELTDPGPLKDDRGQAKTELSLGMLLGLLNEIIVMLKGREPLQQGNDPIEGSLHRALVVMQVPIGRQVGEGMARASRAGIATVERSVPNHLASIACSTPDLLILELKTHLGGLREEAPARRRRRQGALSWGMASRSWQGQARGEKGSDAINLGRRRKP